MKNHLPIVVLIGCAAVFVLGVTQLFELRFEGGDVYPPYSTLRADPLGAMAFYEGLEKLPPLTVRRDFSTSNRLPTEPNTAYLHLANQPFELEWLDDDVYHEIKNFVTSGGRLAITYSPETTAPLDFWDDEKITNSPPTMTPKSKSDHKPAAKDKKKKKNRELDSYVNLEDEWGFHESFEKLPADGDIYQPVTVYHRGNESLPRTMQWHSGMIFTNCDSAWNVVYVRGTNAVVLERHFGAGTVVLASDSYFVSNEAMTKDRQPALLAWLVGSNTHVVFDEAHLGIAESPGIASLMRQYHLQGLAAGLFALAALFIWKNSTSLVPPRAEATREDFVAGKDSSSGFINLLRRNISRHDVFKVCFAEWKKSSAPAGEFSNSRLKQAAGAYEANEVLPANDRNPVATYNKISEILGNRRQKL